MLNRVTFALTLAAINHRVRAHTGPQPAPDAPSHPVRRPGRHRRPNTPARAAAAVRTAAGRAHRATTGMFGIYNAGGHHRRRGNSQ